MNRRQFIKAGVAAGGALGFPIIVPSSVLGRNDNVAPSNRVAIGVIGCGSQSARSCGAYANYAKSDITAVCDPFKSRQQRSAAQWGAQHLYTDFRELLARDDIDAVHIVTPDHWHVPISLAAARAGKDVYCEKPLGISIEQDLAAREIVDDHNRVFQYGTQQRSMDACRMAIELVVNGHIGEVQEVYVWAPGGPGQGGDPTPQPIPEDLDYDMWIGPAPEKPYCPDRVTKWGAYHIYDYAIGYIAGWGAHPLDLLQWWADQKGLGIPVEYTTTGNVAVGPLFNAVSTWQMKATYANGLPMHFMDAKSARNPGNQWPEDVQSIAAKQKNGTFFRGTNGWVAVSRGVLQASSQEIRRAAKDPGAVRLPVSRNHSKNFVDCVLSREQPVASLESGIRSDIISHMGDIGIRTGESLKWDPVKESVIGSPDAVQMMHRPMRAPWSL